VSCTSIGNCTAVGGTTAGFSAGQPIYVRRVRGRWSQIRKLSGPVGGGGFGRVSCTSIGNCTAVGLAGTFDGAIYASDIGGNWGPVREIRESNSHSMFDGVSCPSPGNCTAVGWEFDVKPFHSYGITSSSPNS
jgi:hypothetical protein